MAETVNYENRWDKALDDAFQGDYDGLVHKMPPEKIESGLKRAFRDYLLQCYSDHVRSELGNAWAPEKDLDVLKLKAALVNQWEVSAFQESSPAAIVNALAGELGKFRLSEKAYEPVAHLESGGPPGAFGNRYKTDFIGEMAKHHRPAPPAD